MSLLRRYSVALVVFSLTLPSQAWSSKSARPVRELSVLTYDSLMAEGGLGRELVSRFEKKCGCKVSVQLAGDAAQMVSRLQLDAFRKKFSSHVVLGIDDTLWPAVRPLALKWMPQAKFTHQVGTGFVPMDYGVLALMWNPQWKGFSGGTPPPPPRRWRELLDPRWSKRLLLQDPRTSTPGLGFLKGVRAIMGDNFAAYFRSLRNQWLTLAPGWSGAYDLFLKEEAPLVWSYTSSQAYHRMRESNSTLQTIVFEDGNPLQIEGALIVAPAVDKVAVQKLAQEFLSFMVSPEIQQLIPVKQWMFPSIVGVTLPPDFQDIPKPIKVLASDNEFDLKKLLADWEFALQ